MTGVIFLFLLGVLLVLIAVGLLIVVVKNLDWCDLTDCALGMAMGCMCLMILLLGVLMIAATLTSDSNTVPYKERYVTKCEMMGGTYRSESIYNVATKTHRESHYCAIRGFEFEDIGA